MCRVKKWGAVWPPVVARYFWALNSGASMAVVWAVMALRVKWPVAMLYPGYGVKPFNCFAVAFAALPLYLGLKPPALTVAVNVTVLAAVLRGLLSFTRPVLVG